MKPSLACHVGEDEILYYLDSNMFKTLEMGNINTGIHFKNLSCPNNQKGFKE